MTGLALTHPKTVRVNGTEFRDNLRAKLDRRKTAPWLKSLHAIAKMNECYSTRSILMSWSRA